MENLTFYRIKFGLPKFYQHGSSLRS